MREKSDKVTKFQSDKEKGYHKLVVWQKGRDFIKLIYKKTENFPKVERFGLQSQIKRAAISFLLNIVEGQRRNSRKEFLRFLDIADGSLVEVEASLEIALDLGFLAKDDYEELEDRRKELAIMLRGTYSDSLTNSFTSEVKPAVPRTQRGSGAETSEVEGS